MLNTHYTNLLSPLTIKSLTMNNRVVMTPMGTNFASSTGEFTDEHIKYYEQRAKGGTGLIIVENINIDYPLGSNGTTQIRIDHDRYLPKLSKLADAVHKHGGKIALQINHAGASAVSTRIGQQPAAPSTIPSKEGGEIPRPLTIDEIHDIVKKFGIAARRAQIAGFDAVEIHGGHSYLIAQFMSPLTNDRTDEFGGNVENRARFCKLVLEEVRNAVGPNFPIILRISSDEFMEAGRTLEDTLELLTYLDKEVDMYDVSAAVNDSLHLQVDIMSLAEGWRAHHAKAIKEKFGKPTMAVGSFRSPEVVEKVLAEGVCDLVGMGRGLIAEPEWVNKVAEGNERLLRKCISCNIGCITNRVFLNKPITCTVNPDLINENEYKRRKVTKPTNVVVIGGGTAGLEAACTAAEVGCTTVLLEKNEQTGGLAREIAKFPDKDKVQFFVDYLEERAKDLKNLFVCTNTMATIEKVEQFKPDIVVNATGSVPLLPPIKGFAENLNNDNVYTITKLLANLDKVPNMKGKKVVIAGAGAVGLDCVEYFSQQGAQVTILERLPVVGQDLDPVSRKGMLAVIKEHDVQTLTSTSLMELTDKAMLCQDSEGNDITLEFDLACICLGMRAENSHVAELTAHFNAKGIKVLNIGDSLRARKILAGIEEGRNILLELEKQGRLTY
nr:FAD-dependent oxidoreductase [uncultured Cellulosilyticum sp.]